MSWVVDAPYVKPVDDDDYGGHLSVNSGIRQRENCANYRTTVCRHCSDRTFCWAKELAQPGYSPLQ